jgi:hypothetical protein
MRKIGRVVVLVVCLASLSGWATPTVDGVASTDEYAYTYQDEATGMILSWEAVDDLIYICMEAPGTGWLAVSLLPSEDEGYTDMIIGYVDAETQTVHLADQAAPVASHFSHVDDTELGGNESFIDVAGREEEGSTVIEFSRLLNTEEDTDVAFTDVNLTTMIAFHPDADDYSTYHSQWRNVVSINYISGIVNAGEE